MDFQSHHNPLNSMSYQFQNISLQDAPHYDSSIVPAGNSVPPAQPLNHQTSIMDSIGIQRSSSPFIDPSSSLNTVATSSLTVEGTLVPSTSNNKDLMLTQGNMFGSIAPESVNSSPYPSRITTPNVLNGGLFRSMPPGVSTVSTTGRVQPALVDSQWRYIDTQGQIQGPFGSGPMSQWYAGGYFQPSLQISRVSTTSEPFGINGRFISLGDLISKVNNFQDPFSAFDLLTTNLLPNLGSLNVRMTPTPDPTRTSTSGYVAGTSVSAPIPLPSRQRQLGMSKVLPSEDYTHAEILKLKDLDGGYYHDTVVQIPTGSRKQEKVSMVENKHHQEVTKKKDEKRRQEEEERNREAEKAARELLEEENEIKRREELKKSKKLQKQHHQKDILKEPSPQVEPETSRTDMQSVGHSATEVKTSVAPWADKVKNTALPKIPSISELQKREESERIEKERQERLAANKLKEQVIKEDKERRELKSILTWADKPKSSMTTDIRSQLKQEEKRKPQKQGTVTLDEFNDPGFLEEQVKLWEEAQRSKNKRLTSSGTTNGSGHNTTDKNAWTTVMSKSSHKQYSNTNHQQKPTVQPKSYVSPDKLRIIGSNSNIANKQIGSSTSIPSLRAKQAQVTPTYPGNVSISIRQEFLRWCRSRMQLNASVRKDAVLEVLLSLPPKPESVSIISDTINSNSNAMDGKRFAEDFIRRRREVEKQIKDPLTWSEVLSMPEGDDDDWEFQVVSRRKGRKHYV